MGTIIEKMSEFVTKLGFNIIPSEVIEFVKYSVLDLLGNAIMGSTSIESKTLTEYVTEIDKNPETTIWGVGKKVSSYWGTIINGVSNEGYDFTAGPGQACAIPAICIAEKVGDIDGKALITAIVAAAETMGRLGAGYDRLNRPYPRFYTSALLDPWGAVGSVGKILDLSKDELVNAYGFAGGVMEAGTFGWMKDCTRTKAFLIGKSLGNGLVGCHLAKKGLPGPKTEVENPFAGFLRSYSGPGYDASRINLEFPPESWITKNQIFKPYPACRYVHPYLDALFEMLKGREINLEDVDEIVAYGAKMYWEHVVDPREPRDDPKTVCAANFSLPYVMAVAIKDKQYGLDQLKEEKFRDPEILNATKKLQFYLDPEIEKRYHYGPPSWDIPAKLAIRTKDGKESRVEVDRPWGMPTKPMTQEDLINKFRDQASRVLSDEKVEKIFSTVKALDELADVKELVELLS